MEIFKTIIPLFLGSGIIWSIYNHHMEQLKITGASKYYKQLEEGNLDSYKANLRRSLIRIAAFFGGRSVWSGLIISIYIAFLYSLFFFIINSFLASNERIGNIQLLSFNSSFDKVSFTFFASILFIMMHYSIKNYSIIDEYIKNIYIIFPLLLFTFAIVLFIPGLTFKEFWYLYILVPLIFIITPTYGSAVFLIILISIYLGDSNLIKMKSLSLISVRNSLLVAIAAAGAVSGIFNSKDRHNIQVAIFGGGLCAISVAFYSYKITSLLCLIWSMLLCFVAWKNKHKEGALIVLGAIIISGFLINIQSQTNPQITSIGSGVLTWVLFVLIFPVFNGLFDWLSWVSARFFANRIIKRKFNSMTLATHLALNFWIAIALLSLLIFTLLLSTKIVNLISNHSLGDPIQFDLDSVITEISKRPLGISNLWITLMVLTTTLPTMLHFTLISASFTRIINFSRKYSRNVKLYLNNKKKYNINISRIAIYFTLNTFKNIMVFLVFFSLILTIVWLISPTVFDLLIKWTRYINEYLIMETS
jgi:hypothetical protein